MSSRTVGTVRVVAEILAAAALTVGLMTAMVLDLQGTFTPAKVEVRPRRGVVVVSDCDPASDQTCAAAAAQPLLAVARSSDRASVASGVAGQKDHAASQAVVRVERKKRVRQ